MEADPIVSLQYGFPAHPGWLSMAGLKHSWLIQGRCLTKPGQAVMLHGPEADPPSTPGWTTVIDNR